MESVFVPVNKETMKSTMKNPPSQQANDTNSSNQGSPNYSMSSDMLRIILDSYCSRKFQTY